MRSLTVPPRPAIIAGAGTILFWSCLLIRREKIIVLPADEFVQGPLFHPKWSAQYPPLSFPCGTPCCLELSDVCQGRVPRVRRIRRPRAVTYASHTG